MVMGLLSPRGSQILQHQMQVQPSLIQELVQVLHWELDEESGRLLVTFRRSVVVSTRIRSRPVAYGFGIFLLDLTLRWDVMF